MKFRLSIIISIISIIFIHKYEIRSVKVIGFSMEPYLSNNEIILVYKPQNLKLNDVIVFELEDRKFVKRIAGFCGQQIKGTNVIASCKNNLYENCCVFVLGDNLYESYDSRDYGSIPISGILYKKVNLNI